MRPVPVVYPESANIGVPAVQEGDMLYRAERTFEVVETWVAGTKVFDVRTSERVVLPDAPLDASMPI